MRFLRRGVLVVTALLVTIGVVMVYSSSAILAQERYGDSFYFLKRHLVYLGIGILFFGWILSLESQTIRRWVKPLMGLTLLLLAAVLIPGLGHKVSGASRWFRFGWMSLQPSELAQVALILYLADALARKRGALDQFFRGVLPLLLVIVLALALILAEPDLGTAVALGGVAVLLLFIAGVKKSLIASMCLAAIPILVALILLKPYRVHRILAYANPWADPEGSGFQLIQSLVALGSGGITGVGLGESRQKLFYLPAAHTDFIFAVIGEELGFLGATVVLALLVLLFWFGIRLALASSDSFGVFAGLGLVSLLILEAMVHIGVTTGAIPTKGLPLPFISYGGTALVANLASMALLLNLSRGGVPSRGGGVPNVGVGGVPNGTAWPT